MSNTLIPRILQAKGLLAELFLEISSDGEIPFTAAQCDLLEKRFCEIRCALAGEYDPHELDFDALLAERQQIAAIWSVEDVQEVRPDLTDQQAWEVLQEVKRHYDATIGVTWVTLEFIAEHLFGDAPETDEAEHN
jgi:hypothetical protein